ncbi:MAG TPA: hypothetical protein VK206_17440 [Anaerolineales bacterium]|nr:hypothetical protein [Anaerolineales bacterium]HLO27640.1 hypothetical protein [Anaerolineales bacterium]
MQRRFINPFMSFVLALVLISLACATSQPTPTNTPQPSSTVTAAPTNTPKPSATLRPTRTPNLALTQQMDEWSAETQKYLELGYLPSGEGTLTKLRSYNEESAQLGWYYSWPFGGYRATDFYLSGHFKWSSAYRSADLSGCGFIFAKQENGDHYAVFLDRSKVLFVQTEEYYSPIGPTRGTGRVNFGNPFDHSDEADFTLIVKGTHAYVLVDGELVGEYGLSQSKAIRGELGFALLSGTNKDFGTRCEITNLHVWIPNGD